MLIPDVSKAHDMLLNTLLVVFKQTTRYLRIIIIEIPSMLLKIMEGKI